MKLIIYSKPNCPQCVAAKALASKHSMPYSEIILDVGQPKDPNVQYISREDMLKIAPNAKTMPQISVDGNVIGGLNEFQKLFT